MKEPTPLTRQLAPLIVFIVLIIVLTLLIHGSRLPEKEADQESARDTLSIKLSPFSYQPPVEPAPTEQSELRLPDPDTVISAAARDAASGQPARAEDRLRTALVFYPHDRRLLSMLGMLLYQQKKYPEAEGVFRLMTQLDPSDTAAYSNLGIALAGQKRYPEAIASAQQVYSREPDSPIAALNLSSLYSLNGNTAEALEYFRKAYEKLGENILPLSYNSNFDHIRGEKDFVQIVREAESRKTTAGKPEKPR